MQTLELWLFSLFTLFFPNGNFFSSCYVPSPCHPRGGTKCRDRRSINDNNKSSCHPLEKGDPLINTINSIQPLFNST